MKSLTAQITNQQGSMAAVAIMILALLTIIGMAAITTSNTEQQTASSERFYKMGFFAAEAGRSYVPLNLDLYHEVNITTGGSLSFPDTADATVEYSMGTAQSFNGTVEYIGFSTPPRGSGYEVGTYRSHNYRIASSGYGPHNSENRVEAGFYRIGF